MTDVRYEVRKNVLGKYSVRYVCPKCGERLKSSVFDAGNPDTCPACYAKFTVPGTKERAEIERKQEAVKQQEKEAAERREQKQREQERLKRERERWEKEEALEKERQVRQKAMQERQQQSEQEKPESRQCPYCGESILASARKCRYCGEFLDGTTSPSVSNTNTRRTSAPERTIWEGHPSALYYLGHWISGILLLPLCGIGAILIINAILHQQTRMYTLTNRRVMSKAGIVARTTREVTLTDVRNINMQQSFSERLCGLGSVQIGSAGTARIEVEFSGVTNPAQVRDQIRQLKNQIS